MTVLSFRFLFATMTLAPLASVATDGAFIFSEKLPAPKKLSEQAGNPFQMQFVHDTGATANVRIAEFNHGFTLSKPLAEDHLILKPDLSAWPETFRISARLWVGIGATNAISTDGSLGLSFSQNGVGMSTDLNNAYNLGGMMVLGSDYAVTNGEIEVNVMNKTSLSKVKFSIYAIAYVPENPTTVTK